MSETSHFGYSAEQWEAMVDAGRRQLEGLAARGRNTDYTTFCQQVERDAGSSPQPGDYALAHLLGDIARRTFDERGVVVTALVHYKGQDSEPGPGFYAVSQELGLLPVGTLSEDQKMQFLVEHLGALEQTYGRPRRRS